MCILSTFKTKPEDAELLSIFLVFKLLFRIVFETQVRWQCVLKNLNTLK